jgi:hypothetical protein
MIKITLELYAAVCAIATIAFVALAFASRGKSKFDDLESMKEFNQYAADRGSDFDSWIDNVTEEAGGLARLWSHHLPQLTVQNSKSCQAIAGGHGDEQSEHDW